MLMNSKITTLNNGLRILTYERPETETVSRIARPAFRRRTATRAMPLTHREKSFRIFPQRAEKPCKAVAGSGNGSYGFAFSTNSRCRTICAFLKSSRETMNWMFTWRMT